MKRWVENIISIPLCLLAVPLAATFIQHSMTKTDYNVKRLKRATYLDLKEKMLLIEWRYNGEHPYSLFDKKDYYANYFHASIFRFGDIGYLMTPYGLLMANILQRKIRKSLIHTWQRKPFIK